MASKIFSRSSTRMRGIRVRAPLLFLAALVALGHMPPAGRDRAFGAEDAPLVLHSPVLRLSWDACNLATKFRIEINTRSDWNQEGRFAFFEDFGPITYLRIGPFLPGDTVYYWRVWAGNEAGWSPPANGAPFIVLQEPNPSDPEFPGTVEDPMDGIASVDPDDGYDPFETGKALSVPQDGLWSDQQRLVKVFVQKYRTGSCLIIATMDGTDMVAFMDENYRDGISVPNDMDDQGYDVRLLLADAFNGSLSIELPTGSTTMAVSCILPETD